MFCGLKVTKSSLSTFGQNSYELRTNVPDSFCEVQSSAILRLVIQKLDATQALIHEIKGLDVGLFIAAAGFGTSGDFVSIPLADELNMIDVNCRAVVEQTHHFANRFKKQKRGGIILFGSLVGFQGTPRAANHAATKAFIQTLAEGLRVELKPYQVDVLAVAPGPVSTGFAKRADMMMGGADTADAVAKTSLKALGKCTTVRPGFFGKLLGYSLSLLPRRGRTLILTQVMGDMTRNQKGNKF